MAKRTDVRQRNRTGWLTSRAMREGSKETFQQDGMRLELEWSSYEHSYVLTIWKGDFLVQHQRFMEIEEGRRAFAAVAEKIKERRKKSVAKGAQARA